MNTVITIHHYTPLLLFSIFYNIVPCFKVMIAVKSYARLVEYNSLFIPCLEVNIAVRQMLDWSCITAYSFMV
jgi:hypothetical protein